MLSANLGKQIKTFFETGSNLYIVIAIAVAVVALIVIVAVSAPKKKKKDAEKEASATETAEIGTENAEVSESEIENKGTDTAVTDDKLADEAVIAEAAENGGEKKPNPKKEKEAKEKEEKSETSKKVEAKGKADAEPKKAEKKEAPAMKTTEKAAGEAAAAQLATAEISEDEEVSEEDGKEGRPGTVEIYKDARGEFHFRFRSINGSIVGHSQAYKSKDGCKNGIRSVVNTCEEAIIADTTRRDSDYVQTIGQAAFEIYRDNAEQYRYRLVAKNATNILASQGYTNKTNCIKGAESIIRMSKNHVIKDETLRKPKDAE